MKTEISSNINDVIQCDTAWLIALDKPFISTYNYLG